MPDRYDVVIGLNYYAPYVSGLTEVARMVAEDLAARGERVAVVCAQHEKALPRFEVLEGVEVHRCPVVLKLGKGVISPSLVPTTVRLARKARVLNLHLPMLEAGAIALATPGVPKATVYQCDVSLPPSVINRAQQAAMDLSCRTALRLSRRVLVSSADYAAHSRLHKVLSRNQRVTAPICRDRRGGQPSFRETDGFHLGFLGRIVEEKGLTYLVEGFRGYQDPDARLLIGGDFAAVAGGSVVEDVRRAVGDDTRIKLLGFLPDEKINDFYASLDAFALVSVNPFEAFGIVQVEGLMAGVPAISSDLYGVRTPVQNTGFGQVVPKRNAPAITAAIEKLAAADLDRNAGAAKARELYSTEVTLATFRTVFNEIKRP